MIIIEFIEQGNLRCFLSNNFKDSLWKNKIEWLLYISIDLCNLHELGYCHKDFHSGNLLQDGDPYISDFGLSGPSNEQESDDKIFGVLPYIAPEVLNGKPYTKSSDIYSFLIFLADRLSRFSNNRSGDF